MIYLFYGTDVEKVRSKAFEWVAKARTKESNVVYTRFAQEELSPEVCEDISLSGGLFVQRRLILIDDPFQNEDKVELLEEHIDRFASSDNAIIILAPKLVMTKAKKFIAKAKVEYKYNKIATREITRGFNTNLVNALASRNREKLWLELNRALYAGDAPEMLHGLLHWKARALGDRQLSLDLISLLQSSRRSGLDLSLSLERFALSI